MLKQSYNQETGQKMSINNCETQNESDCTKFLEVVQLVIDNEATEKEIEFFKHHIQKCAHCLDHYNLEKSVAKAIKTKIESKCCPEKLVHIIKKQIREASI